MAQKDIHHNKKVAELTGIDENTVGRIVTNKAKAISIKNLNRLCQGLGVTPGELYEYTPDN